MTERWTFALLLALLLGHLFLLSTHQRSQGNRLERMLLTTFGPVGHAVVGTSDAVGEVFDSFRLAASLRRENAALREELERLRHDLARLQGLEEDFELLSRNVGYTPAESGDLVVADVVWLDRESWLKTLVLYTGTKSPRRNQPVLTDEGLVGRVIVPAGRYAKVLLLSDPSLVVSAMVVRTRQRGLVRGGEVPQLENIPLLADVEVGDEVVTAGIDGIFPRGIPIGRVVAVEDGQSLFLDVAVEAAVDFGSLDQVYVMTVEALPAEIRENLDIGDGE